MVDILLVTLFVLAPWFAIAFACVALYYLYRVHEVLEQAIRDIETMTGRRKGE